MRTRSLFFAACVCAGLLVGRLQAQATSRCSTYATSLQSGPLTDTDAQLHAAAQIQGCARGVRSHGMQVALERHRQLAAMTDPDVELFGFATRDPAVFGTLVSIAGDPRASSSARVLSIAALLHMVDDAAHGLSFEQFTSMVEGDVCVAGGSPIQSPFVGGPLPADSTSRVYALLRPLERAARTEPMVRSAAHCALNALRHRDLGDVIAMAPLDARDFSISYVCESTYRITNRARYSYLATWRVPGRARPVVLRVTGTHGTRASVDTYFEVDPARPTQLLIEDAVIPVRPAQRKSCAP